LDCYLTVVYGPPLAGKTTLAWELARTLPDKTAVVSVDQLLGGSIAVPDEDELRELEMVHTQLRLLVANYLKNRYHVVVEGPFCFETRGGLLSYEADIDQLVALMRNLARRAVIVKLDADPDMLRERARVSGREGELEAALRLRGAYRPRYGDRFRSFDSGTMAAGEIAAEARAFLTEGVT
jgi:hypothetical protein